jgi:hypothetical protein
VREQAETILSWIKAILLISAIDAEITPKATNQVTIDGKHVEIRTARATSRVGVDKPRYQFNVSTVDYEDWFLLAGCITDQGIQIFYIPGNAVEGPTVQITRDPWEYDGSYAKYLNDHTHLINWVRR